MSNTKKHYSTFNLFIRSTMYVIYSVVAIFFFSLALIATYPLPLHRRYYVVRFIMWSQIIMLKKICHINYEVEGFENLPKDRNAIVFCKHQSTWETFYLPTIIPDAAFIAKEEILWVPFFGWGFAMSQPITINRSNKGTAMQQIIKKGTQCLAEGRWVVVFPEGTRIPVGQVGQYKLGGARLAATTGYPVIPIAHNAGRFWPRRKFLKQPGTVRFIIGPMIDSKDRTPEEILNLAKDWIETTVLRIDSSVDKAAN